MCLHIFTLVFINRFCSGRVVITPHFSTDCSRVGVEKRERYLVKRSNSFFFCYYIFGFLFVSNKVLASFFD